MTRPDGEPVTRSLGRGRPWVGVTPDGGVAAGTGAMSLAAAPGGPASIASTDDSLGGLALPLGFAVDDDLRIYWLHKASPGTNTEVRRLELATDPAHSAFRTLHPSIGGATPSAEARELAGAQNLCASGPLLVVADTGNSRVQVFDRRTLALRAIWPFPGSKPLDVAGRDGVVYVLTDAVGQPLYRFTPGDSAPRPFPLTPFVPKERKPGFPLEPRVTPDIGRWDRIALDREGHIYLRPENGSALAVYDPRTGRGIGEVRDVGEVREKFDPPPARSADYRVGAEKDQRTFVVVPAELNRPAGRCRPPAGISAATVIPPPRPPTPQSVFLFDDAGEPVTFGEPAVPVAPYRTRGVWVSGPLDSDTYQCVWDHIDLETVEGGLPIGTMVRVSVATSDEEQSLGEVAALPEGEWRKAGALVGGEAGPTDIRPKSVPVRPTPAATDFLLDAPPGRYAWVRVELGGDGYATPRLRGIDIRGPRDSYLRYLPAVFSADEQGRSFLERFLGIFQAEWGPLEEWAESTWRLFDPRTVPDDAGLLGDLAEMIGWRLPAEWSIPQRRRLLQKAADLATLPDDPVTGQPGHSRRGTVEGLRDLLRVHLWNETGHPPKRQGDFPVVIEEFRERRAARIGQTLARKAQDGKAQEDPRAPRLAGGNELGRVILDQTRLGQAELVSPGEPGTDWRNRHAYRFRVIVPAAWTATAEAEGRIRAAIEAEKPAHTDYELERVSARLCVEMQSTVGVDTIVGAATLDALPADPGRPTATLTPGTALPPAGPPGPGVIIDPTGRVGLDSTIT